MQSASSVFWKGFWLAAPFCIVVAPFGIVFGVLSGEAGLSVLETFAFSLAVLAGAAQFTALSLMQDQAPTIVIIATALAVNLRMALYSASLAIHLKEAPIWQRALVAYSILDPSFALSDQQYGEDPAMPIAHKVAFFFGTTCLATFAWIFGTLIGAILGTQIPESWALDFAVPIAFLAVIAPALRTLAMVAAAISSAILALLFAPIPFGLGLLLAAICAMIIGAEVERRTPQVTP